MVVDSSASNVKTWPWVSEAMASLHSDLLLQGIGIAPTENRWGLVGFGGTPGAAQFGPDLFGSIDQLYAHTFDANITEGGGGAENGLRALQFTLDNFEFRDPAAKHLVLIADEPSQGGPINGETLADLQRRLIDGSFTLNVITNTNLRCANGAWAIGTDAEGRGYYADGTGYARCDVDVSKLAEEGYYRNAYVIPYIETAFKTGGLVWSWTSAVDGYGPESGPLRRALASTMFATTLKSGSNAHLADLAIDSVELLTDTTADILLASISNRGLSGATSPGRLEAHWPEAPHSPVTTVEVEGLDAGQSVVVPAPLPVNPQSNGSEIVLSVVGETTSECDTENNSQRVPIVTLEVNDDAGGRAFQTFVVNVRDVNHAPIIESTPPAQVAAGAHYVYQVVVDDPDIGDGHYFTIDEGPDGASLDPYSGRFVFTPQPSDSGQHSFTISVKDLSGAVASQEFVVHVAGGYSPPEFSAGHDTAVRAVIGEESRVRLQLNADPASDLTYSLLEAPLGAQIDAVSGELTWASTADFWDTLSLVIVHAEDQYGNSTVVWFPFYSDYPNEPPEVVSKPAYTVARHRQSYFGSVVFTDPNIRENFSIDLTSSAPDLVSYLTYGGIAANVEHNVRLSWGQGSVDTLYDRRLPETDYLCQRGGVGGSAAVSFSEWRNTGLGGRYNKYHLLASPLSDTNGDGAITTADRAQLIVQDVSGGFNVYDATDNAEMDAGTLNAQGKGAPYSYPAIADINADGVPDLVVVQRATRRVAAISTDDGRLLWESTAEPIRTANQVVRVAIADTNRDGLPEILVGHVFLDGSGNTVATLAAPPTDLPTNAWLSPSYAIDITGDGNAELLHAGRAYNNDGSLLWQAQSLGDHVPDAAYMAVGDLDRDGSPEVVIVERGSHGGAQAHWSVVDAFGTTILSPQPIEYIGQPHIADFDGAAELDVFIAGDDSLYDASGRLRWRYDAGRGDHHAAVVADIQGDNRLELFANRGAYSRVVDGATGLEIARGQYASGSPRVAPLLADLDRDGHLEVANTASRSIGISRYSATALRDGLPLVRLQGSQQPEAILGNLQVNPTAEPSWQLRGEDQILAPAARDFDSGLPDLWIDAPAGDYTGALTVNVRNRGTADMPTGFWLELFAADPASGADPIAARQGPALAIGEQVSLQLDANLPGDFFGEVVAKVTPLAPVEQCQNNNDVVSAHSTHLRIRDHADAFDEMRMLLGATLNPGAYYLTMDPVPSIEEGEELRTRVIRHWHTPASADDNDSTYFHFDKAPPGAKIDPQSGEITWQTGYSDAGSHSFDVRLRAISGAWRNTTFTAYVADVPNAPPVIEGALVARAYVGELWRQQVQASDPDGDALSYELLSGPDGMSIDRSTGWLEWTPASEGRYDLEVRVSDGKQPVRATFALDVEARAMPPRIVSEPPLEAVAEQPYSYTVSAEHADGGVFELIKGPAQMALDQGTVRWSPAAAQAGLHEVAVRVSTSAGSATQRYDLVVHPPNTAPTIVSSPPLTAAAGALYHYQLGVEDPDGDVLTPSLVQHPTTMSIDASGLIRWTPQAADIGVHTVSIQVDDNRGGIAEQSYALEVVEQGRNVPPTILSRPATTVREGTTYAYSVEATDPNGDPLAFQLMSAPTGASIDATGRMSWPASTAGSFDFLVRVDDGASFVEQGWTLQVWPASTSLTAQLRALPQPADPGQQIYLEVGVEYAAGPVSATATLDGAPLEFDAALRARLSLAEPGSYALNVAVQDSYDTVQLTETLWVRDPNDQEAPTVRLTGPAENATITAPASIRGEVLGDDVASWQLFLYDGDPKGTPQLLAEGESAFAEQSIAPLDPTLMLNGEYRILLQATDTSGNVRAADAGVLIDGAMKVGDFSMTFEDLTVPMVGLPITVVRTYDSRRRDEALDFGYGWSVGYQSVRVSEGRAAGLGWHVQSQGAVVPTYCVKPISGQRTVSVTLPDGIVEQFRARAEPECQQGAPATTVALVYDPLPGTRGQLEQTSYGILELVDGHLVDAGRPEDPVDPDEYRYTAEDGVAYELHQGFTLQRLEDVHGNSVTFGADGITHSNGERVEFVRDAQGRIVSLRAPDGRERSYSYDAAGDLVAATDTLGNTTQFSYLVGHYVHEVFDPLGQRVARNFYDDDGRLIATEDGEGQRVDLAHNIAGRTQTVTDRRGNATVYVYNDRGDILSETNSLGETTTRTYDDFGYELSRTDALGRTQSWTYDDYGNALSETNAAGDTRSYTYSAYHQLISEIAPDGSVTSRSEFVNDDFRRRAGPLRSIEDALGARTSFGYDTGGNLTSFSDAVGQQTQYLYDIFGRKIEERAPNGRVTRYGYDGKQTWVRSEQVTRTLADGSQAIESTTFDYDAKGRLVQTTDPLGNTTVTEYDALDRIVAEVDARGLRTEHDYNRRGERTRTRHPDGRSEQWQFDANGNEVAYIDKAGRITRMQYDAANRLIATLYPDATPEDDSDNPRALREYDAAGQLTAEIDENGNRTLHSYDAAGRLASTTDAVGHSVSYAYDMRGNRSAMTTAQGTTRFIYDAADRLIRTEFADGTSVETSYDALGRRVSETDPNGRVTQYEYDALGNLSAVVDALGQRTSYAYDELGNKVSQTDAEGRVTRWSYDAAGRVLSRTLPLGQVEHFDYDAAGNRTQRIDFNGASSSFEYDSNNWRTRESYADGQVVVTTYTPTGLVASVLDPRGTTQYSHDARDRVTGIDYPNGESIQHSYDAAGNRTGYTSASGTVSTTFDAANRRQSVTDAQGTTHYSYDAVGNTVRIDHSNGSRTETDYDQRNRPIEVRALSATGVLLNRQRYTLDAAGQRLAIEDLDGRHVDYGYDPLNRLIRATVTDTARGNSETIWSYDSVGNRQTQIRCTPRCGQGGHEVLTQYSYDANDRLLSQDQAGALSTWSYDPNGNTLQATGPQGLTTYSYGSRDRLIGATTPVHTLAFEYDHDGIRHSKTVNGQRIDYVIDPLRDYAQVTDVLDAGGNVLASYTYGNDLLTQHSSGYSHVFHYDALGTTRALTDATGELADSYLYESFGGLLEQTGSTDNVYLYAGEQFDQDLGLYYLRARYMDSGVGRLTQMDTFQGVRGRPITLNKYVYANSDAVNWLDPSGHLSMTGVLTGVGLLGVGAAISTANYSGFVNGGEGDSRRSSAADVTDGMDFVATANAKAIQAVAVILAAQSYLNRPEGHHTIPKYLCGAKKQVLSAIPHPLHVVLHRALAEAKITFESGRSVAFGRRKNREIRRLAEVRVGRELIAKGIESAYTQVSAWGEGTPTIEMAYGIEKPKFISGASTSCRVLD